MEINSSDKDHRTQDPQSRVEEHNKKKKKKKKKKKLEEGEMNNIEDEEEEEKKQVGLQEKYLQKKGQLNKKERDIDNNQEIHTVGTLEEPYKVEREIKQENLYYIKDETIQMIRTSEEGKRNSNTKDKENEKEEDDEEEEVNIIYDDTYDYNDDYNVKIKKQKKIRRQFKIYKIHSFAHKVFTTLLCSFIVIIILYASIDISTNYGPIIVLCLLGLEVGSMLISYTLLRFPFFCRYIKNKFMRARNANRYSHQYVPIYEDDIFSKNEDSDEINDRSANTESTKGKERDEMDQSGGRDGTQNPSFLKRRSFVSFFSSNKNLASKKFGSTFRMNLKGKKKFGKKSSVNEENLEEISKEFQLNDVSNLHEEEKEGSEQESELEKQKKMDEIKRTKETRQKPVQNIKFQGIMNDHEEDTTEKMYRKSETNQLHRSKTEHKKENIYLDDCNVWIKKNMWDKSKSNRMLSRSYSLNFDSTTSNVQSIKDSSSLDNLKAILGKSYGELMRSRHSMPCIKSNIFQYNRYLPITFANKYAYKDITYKEIMRGQPLVSRGTSSSGSSNSSLSSDSSTSGKNTSEGLYKTIYFGKEKQKNHQNFSSDRTKHPTTNMQKQKKISASTKHRIEKDRSTMKKETSVKHTKTHKKLKRNKGHFYFTKKYTRSCRNMVDFFVHYNIDEYYSSYKILLFFRGIYYYTQHRFIRFLSYEPIWIIAIFIRIILWCIIWIWAASYMKREYRNFSILAWNMKDIPEIYGYIECSFQWCGVFDYLVGLYFSNNKLKYIFSFFSIIDLITTPVSSLIMNKIYPDYANSNSWFLILGPIRFLRLVRAESTISSCFFWLNDVKIVIIGIIILALAILFTFSGIMYILEAPDIERGFVKPLDFVYFGVITMSTVGYGDYTPVTKAGKYLTMFIIITCISFVAAQFKRLKEAMFSPKTIMGIIPKQDDDYLLILGPVSPTQLLYFCKSVNNTFPNSVESIFVCTPLPVGMYKFVYGSIVKNTNIKLCINGGNECFICPSVIFDAVVNCRALYILNNVDCEKYSLLDQRIFWAEHGDLSNLHEKDRIHGTTDILHNRIINKMKKDKRWSCNMHFAYSEYKNEINRNNMLNLEMNINVNNSEYIKEKDDQECLLRFIGTHNICNAMIPMTLQLSNNTYKELIQLMNAYNFISIDELKYALLANSVVCKGLFFLILNFFYKPKKISNLKKYIIDLSTIHAETMHCINKAKKHETLNNKKKKRKKFLDEEETGKDIAGSNSEAKMKGRGEPGKEPNKKKDSKDYIDTENQKEHKFFKFRFGFKISHKKKKQIWEEKKKEIEEKGKQEGSFRNKVKRTMWNEEEKEEKNNKMNRKENENQKKKRIFGRFKRKEKNLQTNSSELDSSTDFAKLHNLNYEQYYHMLENVTSNMYYYLEGLKYNIYRFHFPNCLKGFVFQCASKYLFHTHNVFLLGIITINKEIFLNPVNYIIGEESKYYYTSAFSGILLTTSLDNLVSLSSLKSIPQKVCEYNAAWIKHIRSKKIMKSVKLLKEVRGDDIMRSEFQKKKTCGFLLDEDNIEDQIKKKNSQRMYEKEKKEENQIEEGMYREIEKKKTKERCNKKFRIPYNMVLGIYEVDNYITAYRDVFTHKERALLLICGWPDNIYVFLNYLKMKCNSFVKKSMEKRKNNRRRGGEGEEGDLNSQQCSENVEGINEFEEKEHKFCEEETKYNIILLSLHVPKFNFLNDLYNYCSEVVFIRGSALNSTNLIQAGVFYAKRILISNSNHSLFIDKDAYRIDNEVIIIKNVVHQMFHQIAKNKNSYSDLIKKIFKEYTNKQEQINEEIFEKQTYEENEHEYSHSDSSNNFQGIKLDQNNISQEDSVKHGYYMSYEQKRNKNIWSINKNPYIICMIKHSESLEYIDGSINLSYENYNDNEKMNKMWENCGEYIYTFELVSANIFVDEMLHNLVSFSLPISKYAIEHSVIHALIGTDVNESSKNIKKCSKYKYLNLNTGSVYLVSIPPYFYKKKFHKCFSYFLHRKNYLCIGILRYVQVPPLYGNGTKQFVLSCPSKNMKIYRNDQAYVIVPKLK